MDKVRDRITFHVISHTHWDREWYLPFEVFRVELVELIDNLLDILKQNSDFIFHLDGQSIILQDYLEIKPHKGEEIKKFVKSGNILIGPWHVLSDQFLTSGEATIRNLLYGIRDAKELGNVMMAGYLVDQFGQIAQLPQIFKGFGIHSAIIGRGIQDGIAEHNWYGLNGESIAAVSLTHWYNNAQRLPTSEEELNKYLDEVYSTQAKTSYSGHILLMNGCDHLFAQSNLPKALKTLNSNQKWELKQNSLPKVLKDMLENPNSKNYPICFGELRDDNNKYILSGTLSSRVYLKLANYLLETRLEKIVEPLSALLSLNKLAVYPYHHLKYTWKLLLQNHAHDSICGCSTDEVHKEMELRFLKVGQVLEKLKEQLLGTLCHCEEGQSPDEAISKRYEIASPSARNDDYKEYIQLINLTNYHRTDLVETEIKFPLGPPAEHPYNSPTVNIEEVRGLSVKYKGKDIDFEVLENSKAYKMVRSRDEVPLLQVVQKLRLLLAVNVQPFSVCTYAIETNGKGHRNLSSFNSSDLEFENKDYKLTVNPDGTVSICLNGSKNEFENVHFLSVEDDLGDEYNFVPGQQNSELRIQDTWDVKVIEQNRFRKKFILSTNKISSTEIETEITCYKDSDRIDFKTKVNNHLKNKRIRLHFPTNLNVNYLTVDTPFGVMQRARPPQDWINYATCQPLHNWLDHTNNNLGLAFFGGGLADYELYEDGNGFSVTLIRAVGRLSQVQSHSLIETPDAQCNREIVFCYAIFPHHGNWEEAKIQNQQLIYQTPIITNQSRLALDFSSLLISPTDLVVTSLKRSEDKEDLYVLRLFNPCDRTLSDCQLSLNFPAKKLCLLNLNEEVQNCLEGASNQVVFQVKPKEILTFGIEV